MGATAEYYRQAELALASYSALYSGIFGKGYTYALKDKGDGMAQKQAETFAANWTVIDQYNDASGVSATVFEENSTGQRYLAVRGTESPGDINADYILALGFPSYLNPQFVQLQGQVKTWLADGTLKSGFTVTGHSLGGYLAVAIATWNSEQTGEVFTYNAPGLGGLVGDVFDAFRAN